MPFCGARLRHANKSQSVARLVRKTTLEQLAPLPFPTPAAPQTPPWRPGESAISGRRRSRVSTVLVVHGVLLAASVRSFSYI